MNFIFEVQLDIEILSWRQDDKIRIHKQACNIVYYINILITTFLTIFWRFPTTFQRFLKILDNLSEGHTNVVKHFAICSEVNQRFPKIFQNCSKGQMNASEHFLNISEHFPKITKDCWRLLKTTEEDPKMFRAYINN